MAITQMTFYLAQLYFITQKVFVVVPYIALLFQQKRPIMNSPSEKHLSDAFEHAQQKNFLGRQSYKEISV
jgi:hypothetical protein